MNVRQRDKNSGRKNLKKRGYMRGGVALNEDFRDSGKHWYHKPTISPSFHHSIIPLFHYSTISPSEEGGIEQISRFAESEFSPERVSEFPVLPKSVRRQWLPYSPSPRLLQPDGSTNLQHLRRQKRLEYLFASNRVELSNTLSRPCRECP